MQRINNYKFKSLVSQLKNKSIGSLAGRLDSIQPNSIFSINTYNNNGYKMDLLKLYNSIDKIKQDRHNSFDKTSTNISNKNKQNNSSKTTSVSNKVSIKSVNSLLDISPDYSLLSVKKDFRNDCYSNVFFQNIDPIYRTSRDKRFNTDYLKKQKIKIIDIFNKQEFYKKFAYSSKDFKKSDLENNFTMNYNITLNMIKVYCNIFRINFIYKNVDDKTFTYMTKFEPNNASFMLIEEHNNLHTIYNKVSTYIRGIELSSILNYNKTFDKKTLEKMKLDELQNIAKMKNKDIKKQGKVSKINKTKDELISEICL